MRVLHLDSGRIMRGGQWQALRLHRGLLGLGHESLLLARDGSELLAHARAEGLPAQPLNRTNLFGHARKFELVHAHDAHSHTIAALLSGSSFSAALLVVSRRVAFPVRDSVLSKWKYGRPKLFLAISNHVARQLAEAGVPENRIAVVYDGVPVPPEPAQGDDVVIPATTDKQKCMHLALEAARMAGIVPVNSTDLARDLPRARALIYMTRSEGLGSGILMAMSYGVTVIASEVGGIPEIIRDGENGLLVKNDAQEAANALGRIHPALGHAARATVTQRFTEERMVNETVRAYERLTHA